MMVRWRGYVMIKIDTVDKSNLVSLKQMAEKVLYDNVIFYEQYDIVFQKTVSEY